MGGKGFRLGKYKLIILFFIGVLGLVFLGRRNYFASLALTPASTGDVRVFAENSTGNLTKVELRFKTGPENSTETISTIAFRLKISSDNLPDLKVTDDKGNEVFGISPSQELVDTGNWEFPVNRFEEKDGNLFVELAAVYKDKNGYKTSDYKTLATFYLSGVDDKNLLDFEFDKEMTEMFSKRRPVTDIWGN